MEEQHELESRKWHAKEEKAKHEASEREKRLSDEFGLKEHELRRTFNEESERLTFTIATQATAVNKRLIFSASRSASHRSWR